MEESMQQLLPPNIDHGSSSGSGQSWLELRPRALKTPSKDAQGGVAGRLLPHRPFGICHTRFFSFSLGPRLWVCPWRTIRQTTGNGASQVIFGTSGMPVPWHKGTQSPWSPSVWGWEMSGAFGPICRRQMSSPLRWCHSHFLNLYNLLLLTGGHHTSSWATFLPWQRNEVEAGLFVRQLKSVKVVSLRWIKQNKTEHLGGPK